MLVEECARSIFIEKCCYILHTIIYTNVKKNIFLIQNKLQKLHAHNLD